MLISLRDNEGFRLVDDELIGPSYLVVGCLGETFLFIALDPGLPDGIEGEAWADGAVFEVAVENPSIGLDDAWRSSKWYWYDELGRFFHEEPGDFLRVLKRAETVRFFIFGNGAVIFPEFSVQPLLQTEAQDLVDACPAHRFRLDE